MIWGGTKNFFFCFILAKIGAQLFEHGQLHFRVFLKNGYFSSYLAFLDPIFTQKRVRDTLFCS